MMSVAYPVAYIDAVAFAAPGMPDWSSAQAVLRGEQPYVASELPAYQPTRLPPNERRRASQAVRMAFRLGEALLSSSSVPANTWAGVFASADGDLNIAQRICLSLAGSPRLISPTDFHNSVHNAPSGYWSIASEATGPSTALAAGDESFMAGLLEAMTMTVIEQTPTLLLVCDVPAPMPLHAKRPVAFAAGVALVLTPQTTAQSVLTLGIATTDAPTSTLADATLEAMRPGNPAARALPLLKLIAQGKTGEVVLSAAQQSWRVSVTPVQPKVDSGVTAS